MAINLQAYKEQHPYSGQEVGAVVVDNTVDIYMQQLAAAADKGDEVMFLAARQKIDWRCRPAIDFVRAIAWALAAGAYRAAHNLATQGVEQYPDHQELQKLAYLLASPKVIQRDLSPDLSQRANRDWIHAHSAQYRGQWVALRNGELLATAASLHALTQQLGISRDILFTKVF